MVLKSIPLQLLLVIAATYFVTGHNPVFQNNEEECPILRIEVDYDAHGTTVQLGNLTMYQTQIAPPAPNRLLIHVHDIFGMSPNAKLFADSLAEDYGFRVVVPDFYRGVPWDHTKWPPIPEEYAEWQETVANWDTIVQYDVKNIIDYYRILYNITEVGIYGFCWGGKVSALAAGQMPIKVAGLVHPSSITTEMVEDSKAPMYLFPCMDDPDMLPFYNILKRNFGDNSGHRRYDDMCHGFATSMGNFSVPLIMQRVEQTIDILGNFFVRNLHS